MTSATRLLAIAAALLSLSGSARADVDCGVSLFASGDQSGIGGTGLGGDEDGVGGTGFGGDEDGIGGTGLFGTVTAMGSVCVNGIEVHYDPDVPLRVGDHRVRLSNLGVGHVVWVVASMRDGRLQAQSIVLFMEWVGRVEAVDPVARTIDVAGETIEVPEGAVVLGARGGPLRLRLGSHVAVSGLRRPAGRIVASRIDPARVDAQAIPARLAWLLRASPGLRWLSVEGYLGAAGVAAPLELAGLPVDPAAAGDAAREAHGRVWVRGELDAGVLRAERIVPQPAGPVGSQLRDPVVPGVRRPTAIPPGAEHRKRRPAVDPVPERRLSPVVPELPIDPEIPEIRDLPDLQDAPIDPGRLDVLDPSGVR